MLHNNIPLNLNISLIIDDIYAIYENDPNRAQSNPQILKQIEKIQKICADKYSDQFQYGNADLNRNILLDNEIASQLDAQTLSLIFALKKIKNPTVDISLERTSSRTTIADAIQYPFKDSQEVIRLMPSNKGDYDFDKFIKQQKKFDANTMRIIKNILQAAEQLGINTNDPKYLENINTQPLSQRFENIILTVNKIKADGKTDELLKVPGFTSKSMRTQAWNGFRFVCQHVKADFEMDADPNKPHEVIIKKPETLTELATAFIQSNESLFSGDITHFFLDRAHFLAGIDLDTKIKISDKVYTLTDIWREMIKQSELNPIAHKQFELRLKLIENDLRERFLKYMSQGELAPQQEKKLSPSVLQENKEPNKVLQKQVGLIIHSTSQKDFLAELKLKLKEENSYTLDDIVDFFQQIKDRNNEKYKFIHEQKNPRWDKVRLKFKSVRNPDEAEAKFWHTDTYQKAVKLLKTAYYNKLKSGQKISEGKSKEAKDFIDYVRGNAPIHRKKTTTRKLIPK